MTTYRELLREQYIQKRKKNPSFSLRAFAKQLGLTPGGVSRLFNGKMELSLERAIEISQRLELPEEISETFINLVRLSRAKTNAGKEQILKNLEKIRGAPVYDLTVDHFKLISDWKPMAILRVTAESKMDRSPQGISRVLGINTIDVTQALDRLIRLELVKKDKDGQYSRATEHVRMEFKNDHEASKKYFQEVLDLTKQNVQNKSRDQRVIVARVFVFDESQMDSIRKVTDQYMSSLAQISEKSKKKEKVFKALASAFEIKGSNQE